VPATATAPRTSAVAPACTAAVRPKHDVRVQAREQRVKVPATGGGKEGVDDFSLAGEIGVGNGGRILHPAAGSARELPCRRRRASNEGRELVEWHGEHVVQDEREPLGGSQRIEDHEQRQTDRVGQQRFVLGIGPVSGGTIGSGTCAPVHGHILRSRSDTRVSNETRPM
jgi:hypothetical protein